MRFESLAESYQKYKVSFRLISVRACALLLSSYSLHNFLYHNSLLFMLIFLGRFLLDRQKLMFETEKQKPKSFESTEPQSCTDKIFLDSVILISKCLNTKADRYRKFNLRLTSATNTADNWKKYY